MAYTAEQFYGKIGVNKGILTQEQLNECFSIQRQYFQKTGYREPLSYILQQKKLITREQMYKLLQEFKYSCMRRDDKKIAEIIKDKNFLSDEEVEIALKFQRKLFRNGVGLFQLGEILISKEILDEKIVYEILCEHWQHEHPGKELPEHAKMQILVEEDSDYIFESTTSVEVSKIQESEGKSGYKVCEICDCENPLTANFCQGCSERLIKYTLKVKTDIGNKTVFKKTIREEATELIEKFTKCDACGFHNPISAEICFNCLEPLINTNAINEVPVLNETNFFSNTADYENSFKIKEMPDSLKSQSDENNDMNDAPRFLIEDKKLEILDENVVNQLEKSEKGNVGDTLTYDSIIYDPSSSKLFVPSNFNTKEQKKCPKCGYVNVNVLPFCFGCQEIFEDTDLKEQPNIKILDN